MEIPSLFIGLVATETDPAYSQKYIIKIDNDDDDVTLRFKSQTLKTAFDGLFETCFSWTIIIRQLDRQASRRSSSSAKLL